MKFLLRLSGIRIVESPDVIRITFRKWHIRLIPKLVDSTAQKLRNENPSASIRVIGRSIIMKI